MNTGFPKFWQESERETEAHMFVSNFAVELGNVAKQYHEGMTRLNQTEARLNRTETKLNRTETKLNQAEQGWALDKEKLSHTEQEKEKVQQSLRKAIVLMKKQGLSVEEIACETGLSTEELKAYT